MVLLVGCRLCKSGKAERIIRFIRFILLVGYRFRKSGKAECVVVKIRLIRLIRCALLPPFLYRLIVVARLAATVDITATTGIASLVARI